MAESDVLSAALAAPEKASLVRHRRAILELRRKNYSWREIASFLNERGVATDHTKVFRFITKAKHPKQREIAISFAKKGKAMSQNHVVGAHKAHNTRLRNKITELRKRVKQLEEALATERAKRP